MIQLLNITSSYRETARITFEILSTVVIDKACDEWNFVINSAISFNEELLRKKNGLNVINQLNKTQRMIN